MKRTKAAKMLADKIAEFITSKDVLIDGLKIDYDPPLNAGILEGMDLIKHTGGFTMTITGINIKKQI